MISVKFTTVVAVFTVSIIFGSYFHFGYSTAPLVTIQNDGLFVVANSYPTNATYLGLTAGHWGEIFNVTITPSVNRTQLQFTVYQNYQMLNQSIIQNINSTIYGSGTFTIYLDLGSSNISTPEYTDVKWSVN